jgi:hypothetical protein
MLIISTNAETTETALATSARPASTSSDRVNRLIDGHLDTLLRDFRRVRVWDERARRKRGTTDTFRATYRPWNPGAFLEVWDDANEPVPESDFSADYLNGEVVILTGEAGYRSYYLTYEFDLFPPEQLAILLTIALNSINTTVEAGTHLTRYDSIDAAPPYWDAPLVYGAAMLAFGRLAAENSFWHNWLIFQDGGVGIQAAAAAQTWYQSLFRELAVGVKREHLLAKPGLEAALARDFPTGFAPPFSYGRYGCQRPHP